MSVVRECKSNLAIAKTKSYLILPKYSETCKDHPRNQQNVALYTFGLYPGSIAWKVYTWGPVKCGLYKQLFFIYRLSLEQV